ncbi:MAG: DUF1330 domain-containing protein [Xanthobacteraceae bacterium]
MKTRMTVALSMLAGATLGVAVIQGLHAQAKPKAYTVIEVEVIDEAALKAHLPPVEAALAAAGGHYLNTGGGRIMSHLGDPPKRVAIIQWDSLDQAKAFYDSGVWKTFLPDRDKVVKTIRRYTVEAVK